MNLLIPVVTEQNWVDIIYILMSKERGNLSFQGISSLFVVSLLNLFKKCFLNHIMFRKKYFRMCCKRGKGRETDAFPN